MSIVLFVDLQTISLMDTYLVVCLIPHAGMSLKMVTVIVNAGDVTSATNTIRTLSLTGILKNSPMINGKSYIEGIRNQKNTQQHN